MCFTSNKKRRNLKALQRGTHGGPQFRWEKIFCVDIPCFYIGTLLGRLIRTQYICTYVHTFHIFHVSTLELYWVD
jgi:hypothetical protein